LVRLRGCGAAVAEQIEENEKPALPRDARTWIVGGELRARFSKHRPCREQPAPRTVDRFVQSFAGEMVCLRSDAGERSARRGDTSEEVGREEAAFGTNGGEAVASGGLHRRAELARDRFIRLPAGKRRRRSHRAAASARLRESCRGRVLLAERDGEPG